MVFQTPAIHNPFLFHGFDEPMLIALKFEENQTERSFVSEVNKYLNHILNRVLSQVLGNSLESTGEELPVVAFIKKQNQKMPKTPHQPKPRTFCRHLHICSLKSEIVEFMLISDLILLSLIYSHNILVF